MNHNTYTAPVSHEAPLRLNERGKTVVKVAGSLGAIAAVTVGMNHLIDRNRNPIEYSPDTTIHTVLPGEGPFHIASKVEGSEQVNIADLSYHITSDPANLDVLKDGLQPGEQVVVPTHVQPR